MDTALLPVTRESRVSNQRWLEGGRHARNDISIVRWNGFVPREHLVEQPQRHFGGDRTGQLSLQFLRAALKPRYQSWADDFAASRILERSSSYYSPQPE
jgi:hypothetical protein